MAVSIRRKDLSASGRFYANCYASDAVGDAVYVVGDKVGDLYQVAKVDITDRNKMPAVGVIVDKLTSTECVVQVSGIWEGAFTGLTPNVPLFAGSSGQLVEARPPNPALGIQAIQSVARALSSTDVHISVTMPTILVAS